MTNPTEFAAGLGLVIVVVGVGILIYLWRSQRGEDLLDRWAERNAFSILSRERKTFLTGPFFFRKAKGQDVYYVVVEDAGGEQRSGYVRVGGAFLGLLSDQVDVKWDQ